MILKLLVCHCNQEVVIDQFSFQGFTRWRPVNISPKGDDWSFAGVQRWEFDFANLWIEWRLTAMWGEYSPLWAFFLCECVDGDLLALSYRSVSFLRGISLLLSTQLHLHGNQSFCRSGIRLGKGEKSLIFALLICANNTPKQLPKCWDGVANNPYFFGGG